jgi:hypothetical protein
MWPPDEARIVQDLGPGFPGELGKSSRQGGAADISSMPSLIGCEDGRSVGHDRPSGESLE